MNKISLVILNYFSFLAISNTIVVMLLECAFTFEALD